jgi:Xaa-Pro aminopeptidase
MTPTTRGLLCLLAALAIATPARAQTPEQHYLEWAEPQFDARVYQDRRDLLLEALGRGVLLVPSRDGVSDGSSYRQLDDFWHLTGLELPSSMLVLDADSGRVTLFVPEEDLRFASESRPNDFPGRPLLGDHELWGRAGLAHVRPSGELEAALDAMIRAGRPLAVNAGRGGSTDAPESGFIFSWGPIDGLLHHLHATWPGAAIQNAFPAIARVRQIKGPEEIAIMRRVINLTAQAIKHAAGFVRDGVTERDLEAELEAEYKRQGAQRLAFASIIKSGPNSLWPWRILAAHYDRRNRAMHDGELVIFDVGTELEGYVSDIGRTFPVSGHFSDVQREVLEMEVSVSDAIIAAMQPGVTLGELTAIARAAMPAEHRPYMQTGLFFGHYIGLSTGDPALYDIPLAPGMIITVEPWYYNHDTSISVFTEDVVLVTADGVEVLSAELPRSPSELEALVGAR